MTEESQNAGRKWRNLEKDGDGNKYFDNYRYTPYTTDQEFFRDPKIYETEVARTTQDSTPDAAIDSGSAPRGAHRSDEQIKDEIDELLAHHSQIDANDIQVEVQEGMVTLSGIVDSQEEKWKAERTVENVLGVLNVNNTLGIKKHL